MNILRRILILLLLPLLSFLLFALPLQFAILQILGQPQDLKQILANSQIYDSVIPGLLEEVEAKRGSEGPAAAPAEGENVSFDNELVKQSAQAAFSPSFLKNNTEGVIDAIYAWLEGRTPKPNIFIDLSPAKQAFASTVGAHAEQRMSGLPKCPSAQPTKDIDPFAISCLPPNTTPQQINSQTVKAMLENKDFLKDPVITLNNFKSGESNQTVFDTQLKDAPEVYQWAKRSPFILAAITILILVAIVFLSSSRRAGLRRVGITLIFSGIFLIGVGYALNYGFKQKLLPELELQNKTFESSLSTLSTDLVNKVNKIYWLFGGTYAAWGLAAIFGPRLLHRGPKEHQKKSAEPAAEDHQPKIEGPEPPKSEHAASAPVTKAQAKPEPKSETPPAKTTKTIKVKEE